MCLFDNTIYPLRKQVRNIELSVKKKKKRMKLLITTRPLNKCILDQ